MGGTDCEYASLVEPQGQGNYNRSLVQVHFTNDNAGADLLYLVQDGNAEEGPTDEAHAQAALYRLGTQASNWEECPDYSNTVYETSEGHQPNGFLSLEDGKEVGTSQPNGTLTIVEQVGHLMHITFLNKVMKNPWTQHFIGVLAPDCHNVELTEPLGQGIRNRDIIKGSFLDGGAEFDWFFLASDGASRAKGEVTHAAGGFYHFTRVDGDK